MLVLTRKVHQSILIRDDIVVQVLGVDRGRVKIGVSAPPDVMILREELISPRGERDPRQPLPGRVTGSEPSY